MTRGNAGKLGAGIGAALGLLLSLVAPMANAQTPAAWPRELYNPKPAPDDFELPMPCGGSMAFRRVEVPHESVLADRKIVIGGGDERFAYAEASRYEYVDGSFADRGDPRRRFFYLAKYETTQAQMKALAGECEPPSRAGMLAAGSMTWFDAVRAAHRYSEWLIANARAKVPSDGGAPGFLRLPTEAEWEYAARGGVAVSVSEFEGRVFPMTGELKDYVAHGGADSSNDEVQRIGTLKPNPLGLHDMLGNVEEIVLEPFRLNKLARLHGQAGGFVAKGGHYRTVKGDVRSAYRAEIVPFDDKGTRRIATAGFRLALVGPVLPSRERLAEVQKAWAELPKIETLRPGDQGSSDPLGELQRLIAASPDPDVRARLGEVQRAYAQRLDDEQNMRVRAARGLLRLAAFLGNKLRQDQRFIATIEKSRDSQKAAGRDVAGLDQRIREMNGDLQGNLRYYADTIVQIAQDFPDSTVGQQLGTLRIEYEKSGLGHLEPYARVAGGHVGAYRAARAVRPEQWLKDILALP